MDLEERDCHQNGFILGPEESLATCLWTGQSPVTALASYKWLQPFKISDTNSWKGKNTKNHSLEPNPISQLNHIIHGWNTVIWSTKPLFDFEIMTWTSSSCSGNGCCWSEPHVWRLEWVAVEQKFTPRRLIMKPSPPGTRYNVAYNVLFTFCILSNIFICTHYEVFHPPAQVLYCGSVLLICITFTLFILMSITSWCNLFQVYYLLCNLHYSS